MDAGNPLPRRYFPLSDHYRNRFGCKVYKVSVSTAWSCPNREGLGGRAVCIFCDEWGSAAYHETADLGLEDQIRINGGRVMARYGAEKLLVYFQAYTNTFGSIRELERRFRLALEQPHVAGLVIGTRPDCLPEAMLNLLGELAEERYLSVELGAQTFDDNQLRYLSRGHDHQSTLRAVERLAAFPAIETCLHLMFGIPGETPGQLAETAGQIGSLGVHGVKLHNLHVLKGTPLAAQFGQGTFTPVTLEAYAERVIFFLERLSPGVVVHRLNAVASRWEDVVAPEWAREKMGPTQYILDQMAARPTWQGRLEAPGQGEPIPETWVAQALPAKEKAMGWD